MTLEQLYFCAVALEEKARDEYGLRQYEKRNLDDLKDRYDDLTKITEEDKKTADRYEERIREHYDKETAYTVLADIIKNKHIGVCLES